MAPRKEQPIRVKATRDGYYGRRRRRNGDVFTVAGQGAVSARWMERVITARPKPDTEKEPDTDAS